MTELLKPIIYHLHLQIMVKISDFSLDLTCHINNLVISNYYTAKKLNAKELKLNRTNEEKKQRQL